MNTTGKLLVVLLLLASVIAVVAFKNQTASSQATEKTEQTIVAATAAPAVEQAAALPRLVDLGADKCIPCKMMAPLLDQLKHDFDGQFEVTFIDVWKNPSAGEQYGIRSIPTQIFFDAEGKELFRHEGFYARDEILAKWKELNFDFDATGKPGA